MTTEGTNRSELAEGSTTLMLNRFLALLVIAVFGAFYASSAVAAVNLVNNNSVIQINPTSESGVTKYSVDGINQLPQQWFWYRIGSVGGDIPLNKLASPNISGPVNSPSGSSVTIGYHAEINIEVDFVLSGESLGSNVSTLDQQVRIHNWQNSPLEFHFFQYSNFDLGNSPIFNSTSASLDQIEQSNISARTIAITSVAPAATHFQVDSPSGILTSLNDDGPTILTGNVFPPPFQDASWALQWDLVIQPQSTSVIDIHTLLTGPPGTTPFDVNNNHHLDDEDVRAFAFALCNPTGVFPLENGGFAGNLLAIDDVDHSGVIDYDDLRVFAERLSQGIGSLESAYDALNEAIAAQAVPEPKGWLLCVLGLAQIWRIKRWSDSPRFRMYCAAT